MQLFHPSGVYVDDNQNRTSCEGESEMRDLQTQDSRLLAFVLIGLGILFLAGQIFSFNWLGMMWPLFVIGPGLPFLYFAHKDRKNSGLIFPGIIVTGTGLILLYQNLTGHWQSWAYIWALYPVMVGMALQFNGERSNSTGEAKTGCAMVRYGLAGFAALALLFEFFIFGSILGGFTGILWPLALLAVGVFLLTRKGAEQDTGSKRKMDDLEKAKRRDDDGFSAAIDSELRQKIDAALAEDDTNSKPSSV
jgi:hypothetical protein